MIVTTFLSSVIVMLTTLLDAAKLRSFTFWLLGDLSQASLNGVYLSLAAVVVGTIILTSQARALNLMMVGERDAFDFGVEVGRVRLLVLARKLLSGRSCCRGKRFGRICWLDRAASCSFKCRQRQPYCRAVFCNCRRDLCRFCRHDSSNSDRSA